MKCFVTGGAGFIGTALVRHLLRLKNQVSVYDNLSSGKLKNLQEFKSNPNFKFLRGDILNLTKLSSAMKGCDIIYHLAANSDIKLSANDNKRDFRINTVGTNNILESMLQNKITKLVFISSSAAFGIPDKIPTPEDYGPSLPISMYGASKLASEAFISSYAHLFKLKTWIFRLANVTGRPATHGIIFDFIKKIRDNSNELEVLGDGNQEKSYVSNEMVAEAIQFVIGKTMKNDDNVLIYNIGNDDKIKVKDIAKIFIQINNLKTKLRYTGGKGGWKGDVPLMMLSIDKIKKLGWKPTKNSRQCIEETIKYYPIQKD